MPIVPRSDVEAGQRFGAWTVIGPAFIHQTDPAGEGRRLVPCRCDCGEERLSRPSDLTRGKTRSCGCLKKALIVETNAKSGKRRYSQAKVGDRRNRLTVIDPPFALPRMGRDSVEWYLLCKCDCGAVKTISVHNFLNDAVKSCGCLSREKSRERSLTHGDAAAAAKHPLFLRWWQMIDRCEREENRSYYRYGGRGIAVCPEWRNNYVAFRDWALANGYERGLQIDRIDNDGPYSPGNCRFVTQLQNAQNRSDTRNLTAFGETKSLHAWGRDARCAVALETLRHRMDNLGWPLERALITPPMPRSANLPRRPRSSAHGWISPTSFP